MFNEIQLTIAPFIRLVLDQIPGNHFFLVGLFDFLRGDPCHNFGLDQSNPFCWGSPEAYLALGAVLLGFGAVAIPAAVGCRRLGFPAPNSVVIAGAIAAYAYPTVIRSASLRESLALAALGLAVLIPLTLTWIAIKLQIQSQFTP